MKYLGPEGARRIVTFAVEEVRSPQGLYPPEFVRQVYERYGFQVLPNLSQGDVNALTFKWGHVISALGDLSVNEFTMFPTAVLVEGLTTAHCEAFLNDLIEWGRQAFGWREFVTPLRIRDFSACIVEFNSELETLFGKMENICSLLSASLREQYAQDTPYRLRNLLLSSDPQRLPAGGISPILQFSAELIFLMRATGTIAAARLEPSKWPT